MLSAVEIEEEPMEMPDVCAYLACVVDLPVAVAEPVFDDVTRRLGPAARPDPAAIGTRMLPARRIRTRLRTPGPWPDVPVEVELAAWSRSRSEVAVRYVGRGRPSAVARRVYVAAAPRLLDEVSDAIDARIPGSPARRRRAA
jgi:hypothetical protein